jgi:Helix-turn-helix domain
MAYQHCLPVAEGLEGVGAMSDRGDLGRGGPDRRTAGTDEPLVCTLAAFDRRLAGIEQAVEEVRRLIQSQPAEKLWYSTQELAEAMGVSSYTVAERWCNQQRIECVKDEETNRWRIPGHEFRRLVQGGPLKSRRG